MGRDLIIIYASKLDTFDRRTAGNSTFEICEDLNFAEFFEFKESSVFPMKICDAKRS